VKRHSRSNNPLLAPLLAFVLGAVPGLASAADTGQFLFTNAEPLPVDAGGTLFIRVLAVNQGSETWELGRTYLIAEIYEKEKYVASTKRFRPKADVPPGGNLPADLTFIVPRQLSGDYSLRVFLVHNEQRIVQGSRRSFSVTGQAVPPGEENPKPPTITMGGNITVAYRNDSSPNDWQADTSVNLSGNLNETPFEFSANTIHDQKKDVDFRTLLLNVHPAFADIGLGDVSPNFSPLSVSGAGVRGALIKSREIGLGSAKWVIEAVGAEAAEAEEGTSAANGVFQRTMYGAQSSFHLPGNLTLRGNYLQVEDSQGSLSTPGPTLKPVRNQAGGGGIAWTPTENLTFEGDWQYSAFEAEKTSTASAVTDSAWRAAAGFTQPRWSMTGSVSRNGSGFVNLAAPGVSKDRFSYDGGLMLRPWDWITLNNKYSRFRDNLDDDPAKTTSHQRSLGSDAAISFPTRTRLTLGYNLNRSYGEPRANQDNKTEGISTGLSQGWEAGSLSLSYQRSRFTDRTSAANDLLTHTANASVNWKFSKRLSATLSEALNVTKDLKDGSRLRTSTLSSSVNAALHPERLLVQGSASWTDTDDDDTAAPADRQDANLNLQLTWNVSKSLGLTVGGFLTDANDKLTPANDSTVRGMSVQAAYSF